jgi:predicted N-acetyltransferase YhbS
MPNFVPIAAVDPAAVELLLDRAFGTDRHLRTAYTIRAGTLALPWLSFAAITDGAVIGTIQCWPVALSLDAGGIAPLTMVGPVAVDPLHQNAGIGHALMARSITAAQESGDDAALMLIGDPEYYTRFFGFSDARTGRWRLPGPVERRRLLARGADVPDKAGSLGPR